MTDAPLSTIAQMLYASPHSFNFARVVTEIEGQLTRLRNATLRTHWDCEDIVLFDLNNIRIGLAWSETPLAGFAGCILVSVGPCPGTAEPRTDPVHETLCSRLVERIQMRYPPDAMLWHQTAQEVQSDLVDALAEVLPSLAHLLVPEPEIVPPAAASPRGLPAPAMPTGGVTTGVETLARAPLLPPAPVNDHPAVPRLHNAELARVRAALYPEVEAAPPTVQMRLAAHTLNATLIMVWAPLGAAVMTYSILKGEDIRLSSRMMAVSGTLFALSQSPVAQHVAAFAGA